MFEGPLVFALSDIQFVDPVCTTKRIPLFRAHGNQGLFRQGDQKISLKKEEDSWNTHRKRETPCSIKLYVQGSEYAQGIEIPS